MNSSHDDMDQVYETNSELKSAQDIWREQRKQAYEAAKAKRKEERRQEKLDKRAAKVQARQERDQALWTAMKKASEEDPSSC